MIIDRELIEKAIEYKIINKLSDNFEINFLIVKNIFDTRILKLENINIELKKDNEQEILNIYDDKILENTIKLERVSNLKQFGIKYNKKMKVFG